MLVVAWLESTRCWSLLSCSLTGTEREHKEVDIQGQETCSSAGIHMHTLYEVFSLLFGCSPPWASEWWVLLDKAVYWGGYREGAGFWGITTEGVIKGILPPRPLKPVMPPIAGAIPAVKPPRPCTMPGNPIPAILLVITGVIKCWALETYGETLKLGIGVPMPKLKPGIGPLGNPGWDKPRVERAIGLKTVGAGVLGGLNWGRSPLLSE